MEPDRILQLAWSGKLVVCSDSVPAVLGDSVEECQKWVYQNDPHCDPNLWVYVPQ